MTGLDHEREGLVITRNTSTDESPRSHPGADRRRAGVPQAQRALKETDDENTNESDRQRRAPLARIGVT
jgi:hypothetical protein